MNATRVRIFYPADPVGIVPGGIDTFIRGIIKWAPPSLEFSLVGMTTDSRARPVGRWTRCQLGGRSFDCFPVVAVDDAGSRGRVPLSVRFTWGAWQHRQALADGFDVYDFHRLEPSVLYRGDPRPKNTYFHQDPEFVRLNASDSLWRHLPALSDRIEAFAMRHIQSAWCVRESGAQTLQRRYPALAPQIRFIPTWVDADVFHAVDAETRQARRRALAERLPLDPAAQWIVSVGRLDTQKDPMLLLQAFDALCREGRPVHWIVIGDGVLRGELERQIAQRGLHNRVHLAGLMAPSDIADVLQAADLFALSSAYEGMPMALLEALGSGLPAVVTDVGEVRKVMQPGTNGLICESREPAAFAQCLSRALDARDRWNPDAVEQTVRDFHPQTVLQDAYRNYLALANPPSRDQRPLVPPRAPARGPVTESPHSCE